MIDFIIDTDTALLLWVNARHSQFWDIFMYAVSGKMIWVPFYAMILYAVYLSYGVRTMILMAMMVAFAVGAADQLCGSLIRPVFERMRPANLDNPVSDWVHIVDDYRGGRYGFPSCHAANTFALTTLMSMLFRRPGFTVFMILWSIIVCYSRIYLGVHYPGDILAGLVVGTICGLVFYALAEVFTVVYVKINPRSREARKIVATYKRGAPRIYTNIGRCICQWRPPTLSVVVGILTFISVLVYALTQIIGH